MLFEILPISRILFYRFLISCFYSVLEQDVYVLYCSSEDDYKDRLICCTIFCRLNKQIINKSRVVLNIKKPIIYHYYWPSIRALKQAVLSVRAFIWTLGVTFNCMHDHGFLYSQMWCFWGGGNASIAYATMTSRIPWY